MRVWLIDNLSLTVTAVRGSVVPLTVISFAKIIIDFVFVFSYINIIFREHDLKCSLK